MTVANEAQKAKQDALFQEEATSFVRANLFPRYNEQTQPYNQTKRDPGMGSIKIGTTMRVTEDIYSLLMATNFKTAIIDKNRLQFQLRESSLQTQYESYLTSKNPASNAATQEPANLAQGENGNPTGAEAGAAEEFERMDNNERFKVNGNLLSQVVLCWVVQLSLSGLLVYEMARLKNSDNELLLFTYPSSFYLVIARFSCGIILHMMLQGEVESGLDRMKFAINHYYRFENPWIAFLAGFFQATSIIIIEVVNFIVILTAETIIEVVMNFMACAVIAEFDNAFYLALGQTEFKSILEDSSFEELYKICRTSSR